MSVKNIVMIQSDSMDGRAMGCMGHKAVHTPNADRLAAEGTLFTDAYTTNPICCPARASMFSGRYTFHCEGWNNYKGLEQDDHTLFDALEGLGYETQTFGKTDFLSGSHTIRARVSPWTRTAPIVRPGTNMEAPIVLESSEREQNARDWKILRDAIGGIREKAAASEPFFIYVGFYLPHYPFKTNTYYLNKVNMDAIEIPPGDASIHPAMEYQKVSKNWQYGFDDDMVKRVRAVYYAMIAEHDEMLGELLGELDTLGIAEDTYVIYTSDHGEMLAEHEQFCKSNCYEPAARIPLIIRGPGVEEGAVRGELVSLVDMYPTVCDMAESPGGSAPYALDGLSLMPLLRRGGKFSRDHVFAEYHDASLNTSLFMLRRGDYKYIAYPGYEPMLFDLANDRWEPRNLADERPELAAEMDALLRGVCDYNKVAEDVRRYDKRAFSQWREQQLKEGTYYDNMSLVFNGWDGLALKDIAPADRWNEEDEKVILKWLAE